MTNNDQQKLGKILWSIAHDLRGSLNADDFRTRKRGLMQQLFPSPGES